MYILQVYLNYIYHKCFGIQHNIVYLSTILPYKLLLPQLSFTLMIQIQLNFFISFPTALPRQSQQQTPATHPTPSNALSDFHRKKKTTEVKQTDFKIQEIFINIYSYLILTISNIYCIAYSYILAFIVSIIINDDNLFLDC